MISQTENEALQCEYPVRHVRGGVGGRGGSEDIETRHGMDPCYYQLPQPAPVSWSGDKIKLLQAVSIAVLTD